MKPFLTSLFAALVAFSPNANTLAEDISENARLPLEELRHFTQIFDQVRQSYVEEVDDKSLFEMSIIGLLSSLDPHSVYLDKSSYAELQEHTTGEFGGLGIEVGMEGGFITVISPIDDTPAKRAGIKAGDLIIKLNDQVVQGMSLNEAIDIMRGPKGSTLSLTVVREHVNDPLEIDVIRDLIKVNSVRGKLLEPGFSYVRIAQFQENTGREFRSTINDLLKQDNNLKGMVLDLRNNPGGLLHSSVEVADTLLDGGLVVYTEGRKPSSNNSFHATPGDALNGLPIVVLINEGSASAAEIVAGALQDHQRALLLGTDSFGKGSVQTVIPLGDGRGIKLTTARYFTPNKRSIQAEGIKPDIIVEPAEIKLLEPHKLVKEENLSGHLTNKTSSKEQAKNSISLKDNQLYEALNLLKGFDILNKKIPKT